MSITEQPGEWWENVFGDDYLRTYVDRITPQRTQLEVNFIETVLPVQQNKRILDVACGDGRHAIALARAGYEVVGVDLSEVLLKHAVENRGVSNHNPRFIRGDIRDLSFESEFDAAINMFTSFGYFMDPADDAQVLRGIYKSLNPRGVFLIDMNNPLLILDQTQFGKVERSERQALSNGLIVETTSSFVPSSRRWELHRWWKGPSGEGTYTTSIRIRTLPEMQELLEECGFKIQQCWGDFKGQPLDSNSPRMIISANKL